MYKERIFSNKLIIALFLLATISVTASAFAQSTPWPPDVSVSPQNPSTSDVITLTISDTWPDDNVPRGIVSIQIQGHSIYVAVGKVWYFTINYWPTPWQETCSVGPLAAGCYDVYIGQGYGFNPQLNLEPVLVVPYTKVTTFCVGATSARIIYVDADATGANNGSSWGNAYTYLQNALRSASSGDEIRVAQGIYKPDRGTGITRGDQRVFFQLKNGVKLMGGYAGYGKPNPDARDINTYETVLSGEIGAVDNLADNSYHVVTGSGCDGSAMLDGFTITGGNADGSSEQNYNGGGMYNASSSPTVTNCTFSGNSAASSGGGMFNDTSNPTLTNCTFLGNGSSQDGGGMDNYNSNPIVRGCTFIRNVAELTGGGMCNTFSNPVVSNCKFDTNVSDLQGGGMSNESSSPTVTNCTFSGNSADIGGGIENACIYMSTLLSNPTLTNCTFKDNSAVWNGGGIYNYDYTRPTINNCILWDNRDAGGTDESAQIYNHTTSTTNVTYSSIQGWTGALGGVGNIVTNPRFADADGRLSAGSPCIDAGNNSAVPAGITTDLDGNPRFVDIPATPNTGLGTPPIVDMGAYEFGSGLSCITPPAPPTGVTAIEGSGAGKIILRWNPSTCATGYKIFYDEDTSNPPFSPTQDGSPASGSDVGNVTQVTISGLTSGEIYCFAVKAYNAAGESDYSSQDCATASSQIVTCSYAVGDRVILLVDNPRVGTNLPAGTCGTVLCIDSADPELPVLVSWDGWSGGYNRDQYCDYPPPHYPNNSAYWMSCDQIAPGCREGYFDKCGVLVRVGQCIFFDADGGGRYLLFDYYDFEVGDRVRVRGLLISPCLTVVCGPPNGCISHAIVSYCDGVPSSPCCSPPYSPGDRVRLLVSNPRGAVGLVAGKLGTVICCDYDDPDLPVFVSWDGWTNGRNNDQYCDSSVWTYPANSGWWMACNQIAPAGTEGPSCCDPPYSPGDKIRLLVNNPRGAVGLVAGTLGHVICCDYDDPELPIFASWWEWTNGRNTDEYCDTTVWSYHANSGWWMACNQIAPAFEPR